MVIKAQPFDKMQYFYSLVQNPVIRCYLNFSGKLDIEKLQKAIDLLIETYPVLRCIFNSKKRVWEEKFLSHSEYLSIISQDKAIAEINEDIALQLLDVEKEPPLKLILFSGQVKDTLCITVSHLVCDGRGFEQLLYILSSFYSSGSLYLVNSMNPRRDFKQITEKFSFIQKVKLVLKKPPISNDSSMHQLPLTGEDATPKLITRVISSDELKNIKAYSKSLDASMNDLLLASYLLALHIQYKWDEIVLPCPVDLRRFDVATKDAVCNLTSNYFCKICFNEETTFESIIHTISAQMRIQKESDHCLKGPLLFHLLTRILPFKLLRKVFFKISPVPVLSYTNLGVVDEKRLVFKGASIENTYLSTAIKSVPYFQLSVSTYHNNCTLSACTCAQEKDLSLINILMDDIYTNLVTQTKMN